MASISTDRNGNRTLQFTGADKKRRSIRLGKINRKMAESIKFRVEHLVSASITGHPLDADTSRWVADLEPVLAEKLASVGLLEPAERRTLGEFTQAYIQSRTDLKPNTIRHLKDSQRDLLTYFGEGMPLSEVTEGDAEDFQRHLLQRLGENTARRRCGRAKQFFSAAIKKRILTQNPFSGLKCSVLPNPKRFEFIKPEVIEKVIEACPSAEWRLLVALARYGGLRIPSEIREMKWEDIHWSENRITINSPKTEHHPGGECRIIPLFPELVPHFQEQFDLTEVGSVYVFSDRMRLHKNHSTTLKKYIKRSVQAKKARCKMLVAVGDDHQAELNRMTSIQQKRNPRKYLRIPLITVQHMNKHCPHKDSNLEPTD